MLRLIIRHDVFMDKILSLFSCRGEGIQTQRGHDVKKKVHYLPMFLSLLLHDQAIHQRNVEMLCSTAFSTVTHSSRRSQLTVSLFDIFHRGEGKQTQAETRIAEIRWICVMLCPSTAQNYATKGSRAALECFRFQKCHHGLFSHTQI